MQRVIFLYEEDIVNLLAKFLKENNLCEKEGKEILTEIAKYLEKIKNKYNTNGIIVKYINENSGNTKFAEFHHFDDVICFKRFVDEAILKCRKGEIKDVEITDKDIAVYIYEDELDELKEKYRNKDELFQHICNGYEDVILVKNEGWLILDLDCYDFYFEL